MMEMQKMGNKEKVSMPQNFMAFRNSYLFVYSLMMAGDWLQGPYVYALYQHYGYSTGDIGKLFIAGFGSSMIFGTVVGSMADKYGRKNAALTYVVTYIASCITKHWSDYGVLMLGRFFGGIATSLLFTAFESWLVAEHFKRGYEAEWLDKTRQGHLPGQRPRVHRQRPSRQLHGDGHEPRPRGSLRRRGGVPRHRRRRHHVQLD